MDNFARLTPNEPINLIAVPDFDIGTLLVQPSLRRVSAGEKAESVEPRVMQTLIALAQAGGAVVSRDALIDRCWGGRIVGEDAINRCIAKVRKLAELADPPAFAIETISKVGYLLTVRGGGAPASLATDAPNTALRSPPGPTPYWLPEDSAGLPPPAAFRKRWMALIAAAAAVTACGLALAWLLLRPPAPPADRMTLRIMPFSSIGGEQARDLAATVTQTMIERMSQFEMLVVSTSNPPPGSVSVAPRYVLEGNIRTDGQSANLAVQVIETASGHLIFRGQGRMPVQAAEPAIYGATVTLVMHAEVQILRAELARYSGPPRDATDLAIRAWAVIEHLFPDHHTAELALAERAYAMEPGNMSVVAVLAVLLWEDCLASDASEGDAEGRRALALIDKVLLVHPRNLIDRHLRALLLATVGDLRAAQSDAESALADEPENPGMRETLSLVRLQQGDITGSLAVFAQGAPADDDIQARQAFAQGRLKDALNITTRIDAVAPSDWLILLFRAATQASVGQVQEARATMARAMADLPANLKHEAALRQVLWGLPDPSWNLFRQFLLTAGMPH
jgi:DNA-binding winged helix-turn-helix (wHTH) protein/tetratricopeptide (TPR) repeat protein